MRPICLAMLSGLFFFGLMTGVSAMDVQDIVNRASIAAYYQGKDGRARVHMAIVDSQGRERTRNFTLLRMDVEDKDNGEQKFYVLFNRPADINRTAFMVWKHVNADDDRWLYLPALDLVKRIAASDERTSFVGAHFFYEDVSGRGPMEDTHVLAEETDQYYIVKSTPRNPGMVEFASYKSWIHKATFIPVKTEYSDKNGELYRIYTALKVEAIEGLPTVTKASMEDLQVGGKTTMSYSVVDYDIDIPESIFSERYLRNPPRQYLR